MKRVLRLFILMLTLAFGLSQIQAQELSSNSVSSDATMVQITLPAGPAAAPPQSAVASSGDYQARAESSYTLQKSSGDKSACNVLMVVADDDLYGSPIQSLLQAYGDLGTVDLFDAINGTPTLVDLQAYDVVLTWLNYSYNNPTALGNALADYIDAGGKVINLMFSVGTGAGGIYGRFQTENYAAINASSYIFSTSCLGTYTSGHPIMAGVSSVCDYYRPVGTSLGIESTEVARWADGELFVAAKDNRTVVSIAGYVGVYYQWTGQMPDVLHNAILYLYTPPVIPVSNWGIFLSIFLFISFAALGIKKFF